MADDFLKTLLRSRGFSNDVYKAIQENIKKDTQEKEELDREKALGLTLKMVNEMMPALKQAIDAEEKRAQKPMKTIIVPDDK
jgi:hypothetical protein